MAQVHLTRGDALAYGGSAAGAEAMMWSSTHVPNWQKEAEKTTRLYVVVYPSDKESRTFGPEANALGGKPTATGSVARAMNGDEIEGLGYGIYLEPAKESGAKKFFKSGPKVEPRLFTFEEGEGGQMEVKVRGGTGSGVYGMLVRFLVAQHKSGDGTAEMMQRIHSIMDSTVAQQKDAGISGVKAVLRQLQQDLIVNKWDIDEFIRTVDMVVENSKSEGTKVGSVTTVNYLAHVDDLK